MPLYLQGWSSLVFALLFGEVAPMTRTSSQLEETQQRVVNADSLASTQNNCSRRSHFSGFRVSNVDRESIDHIIAYTLGLQAWAVSIAAAIF